MERNFSLLMVSIITIGIVLPVADGQVKKTLTIAAFQPLSKSPVNFLGQTTLPAGQLAIKDINERPDILPDYNLTMQVWNTEVQCNIQYITPRTFRSN